MSPLRRPRQTTSGRNSERFGPQPNSSSHRKPRPKSRTCARLGTGRHIVPASRLDRAEAGSLAKADRGRWANAVAAVGHPGRQMVGKCCGRGRSPGWANGVPTAGRPARADRGRWANGTPTACRPARADRGQWANVVPTAGRPARGRQKSTGRGKRPLLPAGRLPTAAFSCRPSTAAGRQMLCEILQDHLPPQCSTCTIPIAW